MNRYEILIGKKSKEKLKKESSELETLIEAPAVTTDRAGLKIYDSFGNEIMYFREKLSKSLCIPLEKLL